MADNPKWKRGLPPGKYYEGMVDDYEVAWAPLAKWHQKRTPEEKAAHIEARERNHEMARKAAVSRSIRCDGD